MNFKIILFLFVVAHATKEDVEDTTICQGSYSRGFYDPCEDWPCKFRCPDKSKRVAVADPADCTGYFLCIDSRLVHQTCPDGQLFNNIYFVCMPAKGVGFDKCQDRCDRNDYLNFIQTSTTTTTTTPSSSSSSSATISSSSSPFSSSLSSFTWKDATILQSNKSTWKNADFQGNTPPERSTRQVNDFLTTRDKSPKDMTHSSPPPPPQSSSASPPSSFLSSSSSSSSSSTFFSTSSPMTMTTEELSTPRVTGACITLEGNETEAGDRATLHCGWSCYPQNDGGDGGFRASFLWYKDGVLLRNESFTSELQRCPLSAAAAADGFEDVPVCRSSREDAVAAIKSRFNVNTTELYTGNYQCAVSLDGGQRYTSNQVSLTLPVELTITGLQPFAVVGQRVKFTCRVVREQDGRPLDQCGGGNYTWTARGPAMMTLNDFAWQPTTCQSNFEFDLDFSDNSTSGFVLTCRWINGDASISLHASAYFPAFRADGARCLPTSDDKNFFWNFTKANEAAQQLCLNSTSAMATKSCSVDGHGRPVWSTTDDTECVDEEFSKLLAGLRRIKDGQETRNSTARLVHRLFVLTKAGNLSARNLNESLECLDLLVDIRSSDDVIGDEEIMNAMEIISNILKRSNSLSWFILKKANGNVASVIMRLVELYLVRLNGDAEILQQNLVVKAMKINEASKEDIETTSSPKTFFGPSFPKDDNFFSSSSSSSAQDSISLNLNFLKSNLRPSYLPASPNESLAMMMMYAAFYSNLEKVLPSNKKNSFLASRIVVLKTSRGDDDDDEPWMPGLINITFTHTMDNFSDNFLPSCVFWNFSAEPNGDWSSRGCRVLSTNQTSTTCSCDHMTNFAILMTIDQEVLADSVIISTISMIGCILSIVGLVLTIALLAVTWSKTKLQHHYALLMNLCFSLLVANVVFISGIDRVQPRELCTTVAALLHFFYMAAFFLMLAEGMQLLLYVAHVFHSQSKREIVGIIVSAWVLAATVVAISLGVTGTVGYGTSKHCWLSSSQGLVWAFIGPALLIITANVFILFIVLYKASKRKMQSEKDGIKSQMKRAVWNMLVISPLLGITWIFGVLAVSNSLVVFQYIFAVVNSLQGLFIFIFHGICNQVRLRRADEKSKRKSSKSSSSRGEEKPKVTFDDTQESELALQNSFQFEKTYSHEFHEPVGARNGTAESALECGSIYGSQSTRSSYVESV